MCDLWVNFKKNLAGQIQCQNGDISYFRAVSVITLIGSGKTATALGKALQQAGHSIAQVWSRSEANSQQLAHMLSAQYVSDLSAIADISHIYIIAVNDDAIEEIASQLKIGDKIIAHTSGIKSRELLKTASTNYGIFYPFVSMTKETQVDFKKALMMIEGSNEATTNTLLTLARTISGNVKHVDENQRQSLHLSAVFANNFTNHMYTIAEQILAEKGLSFDDLRPLIAAHIQNVMTHQPSQLQTGPAIRGDQSTIAIHEDILSEHPDFQKIYSLLTASIQDFHKKK
jgi:predicted short-subunit dehydrogenase-like oxidoreductase (DUF2520 family)